MLTLHNFGELVAARRRSKGLSQSSLAKRASVSRSTLDALENGRLGELGFSKITNILAALGLELKLQEKSGGRPTLEDLIKENRGG